MKLGKKELENLTMMYGYYKNSEDDKDVLYGINRTMLTLNIEVQIKNNWYKFIHSIGTKQIETIEKLIKKAFPSKKEILVDETVFDTYLDEIEFNSNLSDDEKIEVKNSIEYLLKLDENDKQFKEKYNL